MRGLNGYTRTAEDPSVRDRVQAEGGADEQPAGRSDQGRGRIAVHSSVHAVALAQGGTRWPVGGQGSAPGCRFSGGVAAAAGRRGGVKAGAGGGSPCKQR